MVIAGNVKQLIKNTRSSSVSLAVVVYAANIQDRDGAKLVLRSLSGRFSRLSVIWGDGYTGKGIDWAVNFGRWVLQIVECSKDAKGFAVLPRRRVVEPTFSWLGKYRR